MTTSRKTRWGIEQRLEFIDFRLLWEGRINRQDVKDFFGISTPQASSDMRRYMESAPGNTFYDKSLKTYVAADSFTPKFTSNDPDQYLRQLKMVGDNMASREEIWASQAPPFGVLPALHRKVSPAVFKAVLQAVNNRSAIKIKYQSMSTRGLAWRWVTPHAFAHDGLRWHVRVCCHIERKFKDFILSRILEVGETCPSPVDPQWDYEWHETVTARLIANPNDGESLKAVIENDYYMENGELLYELRGGMVYYLEKSLGYLWGEQQDHESLGVKERPVFFVNREDLNVQCKALRQQSKEHLMKLQLVNE